MHPGLLGVGEQHRIVERRGRRKAGALHNQHVELGVLVDLQRIAIGEHRSQRVDRRGKRHLLRQPLVPQWQICRASGRDGERQPDQWRSHRDRSVGLGIDARCSRRSRVSARKARSAASLVIVTYGPKPEAASVIAGRSASGKASAAKPGFPGRAAARLPPFWSPGLALHCPVPAAWKCCGTPASSATPPGRPCRMAVRAIVRPAAAMAYRSRSVTSRARCAPSRHVRSDCRVVWTASSPAPRPARCPDRQTR